MSSMSPSVRHFDLPTLLNIYDKEAPEKAVRLAPDAHRVACLAGLIEEVLFFREQHYLAVYRTVGWRGKLRQISEQQF
jgi:hypothetical protein